MSIKLSSLALSMALVVGSAAQANEYEPMLRVLAKQQMANILSSNLVINSIKAQNESHTNLSQSDIDRLDQQWRAETDGADGDLIDKVLSSEVSAYLSDTLDEKGGLYSEIFVMDNRGLNVGQSGLTSDYWQGDEGKWQETFNAGADAIHFSDVEFDESSQSYQVQVSVSVVDPGNGEVIGAATFGVNAEALESLSVNDLE